MPSLDDSVAFFEVCFDQLEFETVWVPFRYVQNERFWIPPSTIAITEMGDAKVGSLAGDNGATLVHCATTCLVALLISTFDSTNDNTVVVGTLVADDIGRIIGRSFCCTVR
jgi:hypothetical protein